MKEYISQFKQELLSWPNVTIKKHRFGGVEFNYLQKEMGHIHENNVVDILFPINQRDILIKNKLASPHHMFPNSGWISFWIKEPNDIPKAINLFHIKYQFLQSREDKNDERK